MTMEAKTKSGADKLQTPPSKESKTMTKRQARKQPNDKHKWPQHPKIQDMDVRHKAYIRVAGLAPQTKNSKKLVDLDPQLDLMSPEVKFGRLLGATDQRKRHAAVKNLKAYLQARCDISNETGGISELDLLKLWKGLWYTLYMADKVPVQDELSKLLSELLWCVAGTEEEDEYVGQAYMDMCELEEEELEGEEGDEEVEEVEDEDVVLEEVANTLDNDEEDEDDTEDDEAMEEDEEGDDEADEVDDALIPHCRGAHLVSLFIRTFFRTLKREWGNMDKYRVDKFYTLVRLYMHQIFKYMASRHWNIGIVRLFNDALFEEVLNQRPNGLRYHLIDVTLSELAKISREAPRPLTEATFLDTLEPYFAMCQTGAGGDDSVQRRVMENVLEAFLEKYSVVSEIAISEEETEEKKNVLNQVHVGSVAEFIFALASDPETKDRYRKSLYDMHKQYVRQLKKVGVDVDLGEGSDDSAQMEEMDDSADVAEALEEHSADPVEEEVSTPKSKKEKKRKHKEVTVTVTESPVESEDSSKKSKKKKSKKHEIKVVEKEEIEEEVVSIPVSYQKKAASKGKEKKVTKKVEEIVSTPDSASRRVQWMTTNRSKSYKASMKALKTAEIVKSPPPGQGILLNKGKLSRANVTKKSGRRKATNYF
eukprot:Nitzschia sp. Nitz4//scaffold9_size221794//202760//204706//NITZ4_001385-RA/size221794-processed-gene-0.293-mRNA-1//1//CDS//3329561118//6371//frame0